MIFCGLDLISPTWCSAQLWKMQGRTREAHELLAPIYNWFTEGFDTKDLKDARQLLESLR